jgi:hypothetical protein
MQEFEDSAYRAKSTDQNPYFSFLLTQIPKCTRGIKTFFTAVGMSLNIHTFFRLFERIKMNRDKYV